MARKEIPAEPETRIEQYLDAIVRNGGGGGGGTSNYNALTNKPQINGVTLIGNKTLEDLGVREFVIAILREYGLIADDPLTPEEIAALEAMEVEITQDGDLTITYDNQILDLDFEIVGDDLYINNGIKATFSINNNGELTVTYIEPQPQQENGLTYHTQKILTKGVK